MLLPSPTVYPSLGRCIYCHNTTGLTDEHTIPLCMGGNARIIDGSCKECQKATHAIEGHVCGKMLKSLRVHHRVPTRRPKNRPTTLTILDGTNPNDAVAKEVDVSKAPGVVAFPVFTAPSILSNRPHEILMVHFYSTTADAKQRSVDLKAKGGFSGALTLTEIRPKTFGRVLAKIAHASAVAWHGGSIHSELAPIILEKDANPFTHVGCVEYKDQLPTSVPLPSANTIHQVETDTFMLRGERFMVVNIRLFGYLGVPTTPIYSVIVGRFDS